VTTAPVLAAAAPPAASRGRPGGRSAAAAAGRAGTLLIVDGDERFRAELAQGIRRRGFEVAEAADPEAAIAAASERNPRFAVVELRLPGASGLEVVRELKAIAPATSVVVLTGYGSIATALESLRIGATDYLTKPIGTDEVLAAFAKGDDGVAAEPAPAVPFAVPSLARVEWEHIQRVLLECGGNISRTARALGIHRRSLQRKLAKRPVPR
jgi:two-component system response regulator RegA